MSAAREMSEMNIVGYENDDNLTVEDLDAVNMAMDGKYMNNMGFDEIEKELFSDLDFDDLNKAIILRADTQGSLTVLKKIIYQTMIDSTHSNGQKKNKKLRSASYAKIIHCGLGNVTKYDLQRWNEINQNEILDHVLKDKKQNSAKKKKIGNNIRGKRKNNNNDECMIYMFNVDFELEAKRVFRRYDQVLQEIDNDAVCASNLSDNCHKFDLFFDFENHIQTWLGPPETSNEI